MTETLINSGQELFGDRTTGIYDLLSFVEPGLMLDVGAATGGKSLGENAVLSSKFT